MVNMSECIAILQKGVGVFGGDDDTFLDVGSVM